MTRARLTAFGGLLGVVLALGCGRSLGALDSTPDCDAGECLVPAACEGGSCSRPAACAAGAACSLQDPCSVGITDCVGGSPTCVHAGSARDGTPCGNGDTCFGGACGSCANAGESCAVPGYPCATGTRFCNGNGTSVCTNTGNAPDGTACNGTQTCVRGACVACSAGGACVNAADPCHSGVMQCGSGVASCVGGGAPVANGTNCGAGQVCNAGSCLACAAGATCDAGVPCQSGFIACGTGSPVCSGTGATAPDGTSCGTDLVCLGGSCIGCTPGAPCTPPLGNGCQTGAMVCSLGQQPTCVASVALPDGTSCGTGQVCVSSQCATQLYLTAAQGPFRANRTWSGELAILFDELGTDSASNLSATIDWGDQTTEPIAIVGSSGNFTLSGAHTYAPGVVGDVNVQITASDASTGAVVEITLAMEVGITEIALNQEATAICAGPDGNLWFTLPGTGSIGRATPGGQAASIFITTTIGATHTPTAIAAGPDGNVWFTDTGANAIGRITPPQTIDEFLLPTAAAFPLGITAGPDGKVWFTESQGNAIGRIDPANTVDIAEFPALTAGAGPYGIATGADGNLWFAEAAANAIGRFIPSGADAGQMMEFTGAGIVSPSAITAGPDGNLWFGQQSSFLGLIAPAGPLSFVAVGLPVVQALAVGPDRNLWASAQFSGVDRIAPSTVSVTAVAFPFEVFGFAAGPDGDLWMAESEGLAHFTP